MTGTTALEIRKLGLRVAGKALFEDLNLAIRSKGISALMGSVGTGKSSLLKWLAEPVNVDPYHASYEQVFYAGHPLSNDNCPLLLPQNAVQTLAQALDLLTELESIDPALICVDEPTALLPPNDAEQVLRRLAEIAQARGVLLVSHNQLHVASFADRVLLVAGGCLQEDTDAKSFFVSPQSDAGRQFIRTGGATTPLASAPANSLRSDLRQTPEGLRITALEASEQDGLRWAIDDKLGLYRASYRQRLTKADLQNLARRGVSGVIVTDPDTPPNLEDCAELGVLGIWIPIADEQPPTTDDSRLICAECRRLLDAKQRIVVIGDASTQRAECLIAAQMVDFGVPAGRAADFAQALMGETPLKLETEQLLWDLELTQDLADDGVGQKIRRSRRPARQRGEARGAIATF